MLQDDSILRRLDGPGLVKAVRLLSEADTDLAAVVRRHGNPPLWARVPGFATLVRIILEQQVSLASGAAVYRRVEQAFVAVTPEELESAGVDGLRSLGVTRQKSSYCIDLARQVRMGVVDLDRIGCMTDDIARAELTRIRGVGPWTADVYLLMALCRPDIWPAGDIALLTAVGRLRRLPRRPSAADAADIALPWKPWRAVAARILWHGYLNGSLRHQMGASTET